MRAQREVREWTPVSPLGLRIEHPHSDTSPHFFPRPRLHRSPHATGRAGPPVVTSPGEEQGQRGVCWEGCGERWLCVNHERWRTWTDSLGKTGLFGVVPRGGRTRSSCSLNDSDQFFRSYGMYLMCIISLKPLITLQGRIAISHHNK